MKYTLTMLALIVLIPVSCKKGNSPTPVKKDPTDTTTKTQPGGSSVTITSITPASYYPDDKITINGSGFNPDKTKDTVFLGLNTNEGFEAYCCSVEGAEKVNVISASATQLIIQSTD